MDLSLSLSTLSDTKLTEACGSNSAVRTFCEQDEITSQRVASMKSGHKSFSPVTEQEIGEWTINHIVAFFASLDDSHAKQFLSNPIAHAVVAANPLTAIRVRNIYAHSARSASPVSPMRSACPVSPVRSMRVPSRVSLEDAKLWGDVRTDAKTLSMYNPSDVAVLAESDMHVSKVINSTEYRSLVPSNNTMMRGSGWRDRRSSLNADNKSVTWSQ